jgi:hypothetical protein
VAKQNYHQVRKQKEQARKARQQAKQERRSARVEPGDGTAESAAVESAPESDVITEGGTPG